MTHGTLLEHATALLRLHATGEDIARPARLWLQQAEAAIPAMTPADALELLPSFEALHHVAWSTAAPRRFTNGQYLRAFTARIGGDTSVSDELLFTAISRAVNIRRDPDFMGKPLQWYTLTIERWLAHPTPSQAALLTREDLTPYL